MSEENLNPSNEVNAGVSSGETVSKEKYDQLKQWYEESLKQKDEIIEDLRKQNQTLINSMMKQAEAKLEPDDGRKFFGKHYRKEFDNEGPKDFHGLNVENAESDSKNS